MGAKQSKRSVDISGKEAEGAGEVAAAGAGGEGRVEPLADADALKPAAQLNGDAHIHEPTDKEKQLDSGTPENEKDATTEKEGKQEESEEKEVIITNGDSVDQKTENGDSAPTPEESKKPKKEKVKKKWSLRSISFSRKEKPKQEKKQKEEEPKTNGEPEKVPEESREGVLESKTLLIATMTDEKAAEVATDTVTNEGAEVKSESETKDEKTPETPVTEPITNGSNTPESPKEEVAAVKEIVPVVSVEPEKTETKAEPEPEQLPINGLSIEEPAAEKNEVAQTEETKSENTPTESTEVVPAAETPVQKEVCVDQMPLIESTPPPLPANPPPSSVATFAATTMAPDLTDASLANTAESAISTPPILNTKANLSKECHSESSPTVLTNNEIDIHDPSQITISQEEGKAENNVEVDLEPPVLEAPFPVVQMNEMTLEEKKEDKEEINKNESATEENDANLKKVINVYAQEELSTPVSPDSPTLPDTLESDTSDVAGDLPPPPPPEDDEDTLNDDNAIEKIEPPPSEEMLETDPIINNVDLSNGDVVESNGIDIEVINGNIETEEIAKTITEDSIGNATGECNGNAFEKPAAGGQPGAPQPQDPVAVSDKIIDLIPEVPVVPELNTETLQETSVAAAD